MVGNKPNFFSFPFLPFFWFFYPTPPLDVSIFIFFGGEALPPFLPLSGITCINIIPLASRPTARVEKGDIHIHLKCSEDFEIALLARPMVLPEKDEATLAAEAKAVERDRRVIKLRQELEVAEQKATGWRERADRFAAALARAEAEPDDDVENVEDYDSELDDLLDRQDGVGDFPGW